MSARPVRFAAACWFFAAAPAAAGAAVDCPDLGRVDRTWVEHSAGPAPKDVLAAHLATPLMRASPMLLPVQQVHYWLGISVRNPYGKGPVPDLSCFLLGSAAYYYNGVEGVPELDMVRELSEGREPQLVKRLIELRWFDAKENRKHRWFNVALARQLGWFTYDDGTVDESLRPIPLPLPPNSLDMMRTGGGAPRAPAAKTKPVSDTPARALDAARRSAGWLLQREAK